MKNRPSIAWVCVGVLLLWGLASTWCIAGEGADRLAELRAKGVIEVAVYAKFPPYSYGKSAADAQGIDVELARAIANGLGLPLRLRMISAGESVADDLRNHIWKGRVLGGGVADVMLHVGYDPAFASQQTNVVLLAPYFHETVVVAYRPARIPRLESPIALTEHKIAVEGDTISDHIMSSAYGGALRTAAVRELSLEAAVHAFNAGEVDGVMGPRGELQGLFAANDVTGFEFYPQERVGQMRTAWDVGMAIKAGGDRSLSDAIARTLAGLRAEGSLSRMFAAYGVRYVDAQAVTAEQTVARAKGVSRTDPQGDQP